MHSISLSMHLGVWSTDTWGYSNSQVNSKEMEELLHRNWYMEVLKNVDYGGNVAFLNYKYFY